VLTFLRPFALQADLSMPVTEYYLTRREEVLDATGRMRLGSGYPALDKVQKELRIPRRWFQAYVSPSSLRMLMIEPGRDWRHG
jgi:hypothetical protein